MNRSHPFFARRFNEHKTRYLVVEWLAFHLPLALALFIAHQKGFWLFDYFGAVGATDGSFIGAAVLLMLPAAPIFIAADLTVARFPLTAPYIFAPVFALPAAMISNTPSHAAAIGLLVVAGTFYLIRITIMSVTSRQLITR